MIFSINMSEQLDICILNNKKNVDKDLTFLTKTNSNKITNLNVKRQTAMFLEENGRESLDNIEFNNDII
jgi:hypothetical protein